MRQMNVGNGFVYFVDAVISVRERVRCPVIQVIPVDPPDCSCSLYASWKWDLNSGQVLRSTAEPFHSRIAVGNSPVVWIAVNALSTICSEVYGGGCVIDTHSNLRGGRRSSRLARLDSIHPTIVFPLLSFQEVSCVHNLIASGLKFVLGHLSVGRFELPTCLLVPYERCEGSMC